MKLSKEIKFALSMGALWLASSLTMNWVNAERNKKAYLSNPIVCNKEEFLNIIEDEKRKMGLENVVVNYKEDEILIGGHNIKRNNQYTVTINPNHRTLLILRHELYHLKKSESNPSIVDIILDGLTFGGYEEYCATSYSLKE